jgi:hypothetical protein
MSHHSTRALSSGSVAAALGAAYLAVGLAMTIFILLVLEPAMGFTGAADYMNPDKIAANLGATSWLLVDLFYMSLFVAILAIAHGSDDRALVWAGVAGAIAFFLVGAIDRAIEDVHGLVADEETRRMALTAMLPVRLAVLKTAAMAMALFAWRTTRSGEARGALDRVWRGLGYLVLATGILFVFVFVPAPVVFFLWAAALTVRLASGLVHARREAQRVDSVNVYHVT